MSVSIDHRELLAVLQKAHFPPNLSVERQVASHVRDLIRKKKLATHTRLPPIRKLAELWQTNYFTVQAALSRLAGEGLIVQSPRKGSFVAPRRRALARACLYHDHNLSTEWQLEFYSLLNISLYRLLAERGVTCVPFFDHRGEDQLHTPPPEVRDMAKDGEIDAVIATSIHPRNSGWLTRLEVPVASLMLEDPRGVIELDAAGFARLVIEEAVKFKRKTIGLIHVPMVSRIGHGHPDLLRTELERLASARGITVVYPDDGLGAKNMPWEKFGFLLCERLLRVKKRPDLILVYPDTYIRGVATRLLQHHVRLPKDILLVCHRNQESSIYLPFPVTWLTVRVEDFARALLDQIDRQIEGKKTLARKIAFNLERSVPQ